ncbi:MAG: sulfite exporter TauE/SafE family protein [bacterium]|nr:sulfite exporter TauE/SafE family protein [bacterium]
MSIGESFAIPEVPYLAFSALVVLMAGFVRGYSGFGFSMIMVITLSQIFTPAEVVPVVILMEVVASAWLLPKVWKQIDWPSLSGLLMGVLIGTPAGVYLLANVPAKAMRSAIAVVIMVLVVLLLRGISFRKMPGRGFTLSTGAISGIFNGSAAIGGPPVILFYFSSPAGASVSRASLIAYFLGTDIFASGICALQGLLILNTVVLAGILLIPLVMGLTIGNRCFGNTEPETFRRVVLMLLMGLSIVTLIRAVIGI